jgi:FkbM family methyltransferase
MHIAKRGAKRLLELMGLRLTRTAQNRFDAMERCLHHLKQLEFEPTVIVDGGAHIGSFACSAHKVFPSAVIHMVEPQPSCHQPLTKLCSDRHFVMHPYALSNRPGMLPMICKPTPDTGAHIPAADRLAETTVQVRATTIDELFRSNCRESDRVLVKLDLQGHELPALEGALDLLPRVEIIITEVTFLHWEGLPTRADLERFLDARGFDLFDVASLSGRGSDGRLRQGDFVYVRRGTPLYNKNGWE